MHNNYFNTKKKFLKRYNILIEKLFLSFTSNVSSGNYKTLVKLLHYLLLLIFSKIVYHKMSYNYF